MTMVALQPAAGATHVDPAIVPTLLLSVAPTGSCGNDDGVGVPEGVLDGVTPNESDADGVQVGVPDVVGVFVCVPEIDAVVLAVCVTDCDAVEPRIDAVVLEVCVADCDAVEPRDSVDVSVAVTVFDLVVVDVLLAVADREGVAPNVNDAV